MALVFPPVCAICRRPCVPADGYPGICRLCLARMPLRINSGQGIDWPDYNDSQQLGRERIYGCAIYTSLVRKAMIRLKFGEGLEIADALAPFLIRTIRLSGQSVHAVMSVPLHQARLRERGYNQAEHLSRAVAAGLGCPDISGCLARIRNTARQSEQKDRQSRLANLAQAFSLLSGTEKAGEMTTFPLRTGQTVWLIDDVITTGATLSAAALPLRQAGIRVNGLVMAVNLAGPEGHSLPWPELNCLEHQ